MSPVRRLLLRRLISLPVVLLGMTVVTFAVTHIVPGDPARLQAGPHASEEQVQVLRHRYGYDQPLVQQYVTYMGDLLHGNLGDSITTRRPVSEDLRQFFPATIELTGFGYDSLRTLGRPGAVRAVPAA